MTQFKEEGNALLTVHVANMTGNLPLVTKTACRVLQVSMNRKKKTVNSPITDLCLCLKVSSVLWVFRAGEVLQK